MPYKEKKVTYHGEKRVEVINAKTGHVYAKHATPANAKRQENLLRAIDHGWKPTGKITKKK